MSNAGIPPSALFRSIGARARTPLARSMVSGAVVGIFSILFYLSYAALIFSGPPFALSACRRSLGSAVI